MPRHAPCLPHSKPHGLDARPGCTSCMHALALERGIQQWASSKPWSPPLPSIVMPQAYSRHTRVVLPQGWGVVSIQWGSGSGAPHGPGAACAGARLRAERRRRRAAQGSEAGCRRSTRRVLLCPGPPPMASRSVLPRVRRSPPVLPQCMGPRRVGSPGKRRWGAPLVLPSMVLQSMLLSELQLAPARSLKTDVSQGATCGCPLSGLPAPLLALPCPFPALPCPGLYAPFSGGGSRGVLRLPSLARSRCSQAQRHCGHERALGTNSR